MYMYIDVQVIYIVHTIIRYCQSNLGSIDRFWSQYTILNKTDKLILTKTMKSKTSVFVSQKHRVSHFVKNGTKIIAESFQIRLQIICWISKNSLVKEKHNKRWKKPNVNRLYIYIFIIKINVKIPKISKYFHLVTNKTVIQLFSLYKVIYIDVKLSWYHFKNMLLPTMSGCI